jgi:putative Holliday junction resolvase
MGKILGIDHGSKRIGVALSDETNAIAFPKEIIEASGKYLNKIAEFVRSNDVSTVVIGYPLNMKGEMSKQTEVVAGFIDMLREILPVQVELVKWDERLTSKMAESFVIDSGMKKKKRQDKSNLDTLSAVFILQSYLDRRPPLKS